MKLKNSNCDNSKTQNVVKLNNLNGDKTQQLKLLHNSKTPIVTKLNNSNFDSTLKPKL